MSPPQSAPSATAPRPANVQPPAVAAPAQAGGAASQAPPQPSPQVESQSQAPTQAATPTAQSSADTSPSPASPEPAASLPVSDVQTNTLSPLLLKHIASDQVAMWTSPAHIREQQLVWLVPLGSLTAAMLGTDRTTSLHLNSNPTTLKHYQDFSDAGVGALVGVGGGMFLWGHLTHDDHKRETGLLAGEAAIDSLGVAEVLKYATGRSRPQQDMGSGDFWNGGTSFPSEHAAVAWSVAGILAHEYPGPLTKIFAYGLAAAVSSARVLGKEHFPSDALVGSALGYLTSEYVYGTHHDPALGGGDWNFVPFASESRTWKYKDMGSPFVPLDSWIYPALDRLEALGYISSGIQDMRPWTRTECARLLSESSDDIHAEEVEGSDALQIYNTLQIEFAPELALLEGGTNRHARLESLYTRSLDIAGPPLTDGYHFGQTITDDFGRPYERGFNNETGFSAWATDGPFVGYVRAEYQHAPTGPIVPLAARKEVALVDFSISGSDVPPDQAPVAPGIPPPEVNQPQLLDAYVAMTLNNYEVSFGRQSLWWGPGGAGTPMIFSDNPEPINMFRISRVSPIKLPGILGWLGEIEMQAFLGQVSGDHFVYGVDTTVGTGVVGSYTTTLNPQPFIQGQRVSFKPTPNWEFALSKTSLYGGPGVPLTPRTWFGDVFSLGYGPVGSSSDPGKRYSSFDTTYRLPKLRKWVTYYADGFVNDQITPVAYWDRAAWRSGLYFARLPHLPHMDLQFEGIYTDLPAGGDLGHGFFYYSARYVDGYTNNGTLIGNWIGRQGQGAQAWTNYWFSPRSRLQFFYRHQKVSQDFITYGGTLWDAGVRQDFWLKSVLSVSWQVQYENWIFPIIATGHQSNVASSIQLTLWSPEWGRK